MIVLKEKVLASMQKSNGEPVTHHLTNDSNQVDNLNTGIKDLSLIGIIPKIKSFSDSNLELEFIDNHITVLNEGTVVKLKDTSRLDNQEYQLNNLFFVKSFVKNKEYYEVIIAQFLDDEIIGIGICDENLKRLESIFQILS